MMMMGLGVTLYCTPVEASAHLFLTGLGTFCGKRPFKETNRNKLVLNTGKTEVKAASASSRLSLPTLCPSRVSRSHRAVWLA